MNMKRIRYYYHYARYMIRVKCKWIWEHFHIPYSKRQFLSHDETNEYLKYLLSKEEPCMVCRIGATESFTMRTFEFGVKKKYEKAIQQLGIYSGFFPKEASKGIDFVHVMEDALKEADMCGTMTQPCDDYFLNKYTNKSCKTMFLSDLVATGFEKPWSGGDCIGRKCWLFIRLLKQLKNNMRSGKRFFQTGTLCQSVN